MITALRRRVRGESQEGAALPLALGFLLLFSVLVGVVFGLLSTSVLSSTALHNERNAVYGVNSAVETAIARIRNDTTKTIGTLGGPSCDQEVDNVDGQNVSVTCSPNDTSGVPQGSTQTPGFAILTLAPYNGPAPGGGGNTAPGCINVNNELGIVQVQSKKLITINGNVYVNSDVDSDLWSNGCPQLTTAQHPLVNGNVIHRESDHDLDCAAGFTCAQPVPNPTAAQAALLADPAIATPAAWAPGVDANLTAPPAVQAVPPCGSGPVVQFNPGTYTDATAFNALMNGTCQNKLFYFAPGNYYFDFTNSGTHEWSINDVSARVVGGQFYNGASSGSVIVGPTTWQPATATTSTTTFTNPNNAKSIDLNPATATITSTQTANISLSAFATNPASAIPANAVINTVRVRVAHAESATDADPASVLNRIGTPALTVTSGSTQCATTFPVGKNTVMAEDAAPSYDVTSCLNTPTLINGGVKIGYSVPHCAGGTPGGTPCDSNTASVRLDGIYLDITYTLPGRSAWDPSNPGSVTSTSPLLPGACFHDGDGAAWTNGVQFVFGGDSRINLRLGKLELCDKPGTTHQEIVLYGVKNGNGTTTVAPVMLSATNPPVPTTSNPGFGTPVNGMIIGDGLTSTTGSYSNSGQTRWLTTGGYAMPAAQQIPANATNLTTQIHIAHFEGGSSTQTQGLQVLVRDATDTTTLCTVNVTRATSSADVLLPVPANCLSAATLNAGSFRLRYQIQHTTCSSGCNTIATTIDGMQVKVSYSIPGSGNGLDGASGCITQTPYYSPTDHSPAYQGACALLTVAGNPNQIGNDPTTWNVAALWGTVYAPSAALDIQPYDLEVPVFNRGFVARTAMLGYNPTGNAIVPITTTPQVVTFVGNRVVRLVANVNGVTKLVADVEFCDGGCSGPTEGANPAVKIKSWQVNR